MERKKIITWIKAHSKELIALGCSIGAIIGVILCAKNHKALEEAWTSLKNNLTTNRLILPHSTIDGREVSVEDILESTVITPEYSDISDSITIVQKKPHPQHLRNLPVGWNASPEKIATAAEHGYDNLLPGQTWVKEYGPKPCAA